MIDWQPIWLSAKLALATTAILFVLALPIAYWLAYSRWRIKFACEAIVSLPMVLPPSVLGFYLLLAFSPENTFGKFLDHHWGIRLVFSFPGLLIASLIYSLPFMINPILSGFRSIPVSLMEASDTLGKSRITTVWRILLPNMRPALLTGLVMSFAHTIGEFGVVLMIGGNIPGQTRVASLAIFDSYESMNHKTANAYALILLLASFAILTGVYLLNHRYNKNRAIL